MTTMTLSALIAGAAELSVEQQLELNKALCQLIRQKRRVQAVVSGSKFLPGQVVRFNAKTRGIKTILIEKFNRAGTAVVGKECSPQGVVHAGAVRWTVATTLCSLVA